MTASLLARDITLGYGDTPIISELTLEVPDDSFTIIIGPNACGKSTLLRGFARLLRPSTGAVLLDGDELRSLKPKEAARKLGLLPQSSIAPDGITVADLVGRGRFPHQSAMRTWSSADERAVSEAMAATGVTELSRRLVEELSGGQRQRVWVAMLLAQQTPVMLLDEPTTFLDISHQFDLLELLRDLNEQGKTVITVLHDLNQAARYARHLIVMKDGRVVTAGAPGDIITPPLIEEVFGLRALVVPDPVTGTPTVVPLDPRGARADRL